MGGDCRHGGVGGVGSWPGLARGCYGRCLCVHDSLEFAHETSKADAVYFTCLTAKSDLGPLHAWTLAGREGRVAHTPPVKGMEGEEMNKARQRNALPSVE